MVKYLLIWQRLKWEMSQTPGHKQAFLFNQYDHLIHSASVGSKRES